MFKKDILYKLIILMICFALIIGLCSWKSIVNNKKHYDINRYNLLNEVKLTESSEELLNIAENNFRNYKIQSNYYYDEKSQNATKEKAFSDEATILNFNLNDVLAFCEIQKSNKVDLAKGFVLPYLERINALQVKIHYSSISSELANNILKYKDQLERFKKLEENIFTNFKELNDNLKTDFSDLNEFLLMLEGENAEKTSNRLYIKVRKTLMRFYSILFKLYDKDKIKRIVSNFTQGSFKNKSEKMEVAGITVFSNNLFKQHIKLKGSVFCTDMCKKNYVNGFWSSFNCAYVFIHEMGHAIDNFFVLDQHQRDKLHTVYASSALPLFNNISLDSLYTYCSSASIKFNTYKNTSILQNHVDQSIFTPQFNMNNHKKNNNSNSNNYKKEATFVFAPSKYARYGDSENSNVWQKEFFAECFAYWILTPDKYRDIRWAIINDYFLNKFGQ